MKTRIVTLASAALLGVLSGASGCVENRASVQTQAICVPTDDCTFAETCDAQWIGYVTLDKGASPADVLWLTIQVANNMPNNEDLSVGRVNTNDAHIDETVIEYEGTLGGEQAVGSNFLVPADGTAVVSAKLGLGSAAAGEVLAHLRFRGYLDDGTRFETGDFPITVIVCATGCAPAACGGAPTCPPSSEGQLPLVCVQ
jgi:hypothetical protein